jgi:hypothetical protein
VWFVAASIGFQKDRKIAQCLLDSTRHGCAVGVLTTFQQNGQVKQDFLLQSWWLFVSHSRKNGEGSCARQIKGS